MAIEILGFVAAGVAVVVVASILDGEADSGGGGVDSDGQECEGCREAKRNWNSWSRWKKARRFAWYVYKKAQCNLSGCPF